jgi:hypothetical protein
MDVSSISDSNIRMIFLYLIRVSKKNIRVVENCNNLYMQIIDYEFIAEFTITALWLLSINHFDRKMFLTNCQ